MVEEARMVARAYWEAFQPGIRINQTTGFAATGPKEGNEMRKFMFTCAILVTLAPAIALGQTAPATDTAESQGKGLEDIVVTARRISENLQKVPVAVTVLGEQALQDAKVLSIRDLQGNAPSLYITTGVGGPSAANIAIRGQTQADTLLVTDPSVAVYLNEINLPRQLGLRSAFFDMDQIQVLKGPQGTLFGKNTTGGALLLRTKRPDLQEVGGFASGIMGNLGAMQMQGAINVPLAQDKLAVRLAGIYNRRDGFARDGLGRKLGDQNDRSARLSVMFEPTDKFSVFLTADYTKSTTNTSDITVTHLNPLAFSSAGAPLNNLSNLLNNVTTALGLPRTVAGYTQAYNIYAAETVDRPDYYDTSANEKAFSHLQLYGFSGDARLDLGGVTVRSITGYRNTRRNDQQDFDVSTFYILRPRLFAYSYQFTQELQLLSDTSNRLSWIIGAFYSYEKGDEGSVTPQLIYVNPNSPNVSDYTARNKSYAAFAQANYALTDTLKATAGIRYTKVTQGVESRNRNAVGCLVPVSARPNPAVCQALFRTEAQRPSYLASLDWQASPSILLYAKTSSSFRGGGINVRGQSAVSVDAFRAFAPEKATDYEIGFKGDLLSRSLRVNAAAYYTDYSDIQKQTLVFSTATSSTIAVISNAAKGEIYGGEFEMTYRPVSAMTLNGSLNWTHARYKKFIEANGNDRTSDKFPVPEWQYSLSAKYDVPIGNGDLSFFTAWRWQGTVVFKSEAIYDASVTQKNFGLLEGRIAYKIDRDAAFEVAVFGKNLLDKKYLTNANNYDSSLGYNVGWIGDPRVIGLELKVAFGGH